MTAVQRVQETNMSEVAAGCADPHSPACVLSNSYEQVLQPATVSQEADRICGLGMPPIIHHRSESTDSKPSWSGRFDTS